MVNNAPSFQYPTSNVPHEAQFTDVSVTDIRAIYPLNYPDPSPSQPAIPSHMYHDTFSQILQQQHLHRQYAPPDGDCYFYALAQFLRIFQNTHESIRSLRSYTTLYLLHPPITNLSSLQHHPPINELS